MNIFGIKITPFSGAILLIFSLLLFGTIFRVLSPAADKTMIYFYSSETNINNFKSLKMAFDKYLSQFGPYEFQPFKGRQAFENQIKEQKNCLLVMSSWHYRYIHKKFALQPAAVGVKNGKKYQKRLLVADTRAVDIDSVKTERIASSSNLDHTGSVLKEMFKGDLAVDLMKILIVPKDIDALMSVGFGMSKLALTTKNCLDELTKINPALCKKMKILLEGDESLLLILAVPEGFNTQNNRLVSVIKEMASNPDGRQKIRMLGLDGWQDLDPSDINRLES